MDKTKVYLIDNIEEYGKLMAFCINHDISVFRTYWEEKEKGKQCYQIDWKQKRCFYASVDYYTREGYEIVKPVFLVDKFGEIIIYKGENK